VVTGAVAGAGAPSPIIGPILVRYLAICPRTTCSTGVTRASIHGTYGFSAYAVPPETTSRNRKRKPQRGRCRRARYSSGRVSGNDANVGIVVEYVCVPCIPYGPQLPVLRAPDADSSGEYMGMGE
jgi:hypothetical protein